MSKRTLNIAFGMVVLVAASAWAANFGFRNLIAPKQAEADRELYLYNYSQGLLPELPGPFLAEGNVKDLKFEVIDLGIAKSVSQSENGDLLYEYYGDKPDSEKITDGDGHPRLEVKLPKSILRLRKSDGTIVNFAKGEIVRLTETGHIFKIKLPAESNFSPGDIYTITRDGQPFFDQPMPNVEKDRNWYETRLDLGQCKFTDQLVILNDQGGPFLDAKGAITQFPKVPDTYTRYSCASSTFGTVFLTSAVEYGYFKDRSLTFFKSGKLTNVELPRDGKNSGIEAGKSCLQLANEKGIPLQIYKDGAFTAVPIPAHSVKVSAGGINDRGEMMIQAEFLDRQAQIPSMVPYRRTNFLVMGGKQYRLVDILKANGLIPELSRYWERSAILDENGDLVVSSETDDYNHLYLLKRARK